MGALAASPVLRVLRRRGKGFPHCTSFSEPLAYLSAHPHTEDDEDQGDETAECCTDVAELSRT